MFGKEQDKSSDLHIVYESKKKEIVESYKTLK